MTNDFQPLVSIIIPTYNEEEDITKTLDACVAIDYPNKEIIVVDDSKDSTPTIVKQYANRGVFLLKREKNEGGRCGARNMGILASHGEILVILNADVLLPKDFIRRILPHYENGAGYVLVESKVINNEHLFARYVGSFHFYTYSNPKNDLSNYWTEGYSCLREAAFRAGLFPIPPLTLKAGEDGYFGKKVDELGYKKVIDRSIVVTHFAPHRFKDFWRLRKERISAPANYFLEKKSIPEIIFRTIARTAMALLTIGLILPVFIAAIRVARFSPRKYKDIFPFMYAYTLEQIAFLLGKWGSLFVLLRYAFQTS